MPAPKPAYTLTDPATGTDYRVFLELPPANELGPHPAVVFMDGDDQFRAAVEAYRAARAAGEVMPLVLVGLGYGASYMKPANKRVRDYTPAPLATEAESGGADRFLSFVTKTFWPDLARRVPVREDLRGLAGHSLGSLFVLHALWQEKPFFNRLLASAPSLWWADRAILCDAQNLQRQGVALTAKLFLSVGEADSASMTGDLTLLEDQLAALPFPQLEVVSQRFPGKNHFNVLPEAFGAGLRALFPVS
jgi:predicted alpha/beta superfamily hydrolase